MAHHPGVRGKRIFITGATSGLGLAMAKALLSEGARVLVTARDLGKVDKAVSALRSLHSPPAECRGAAVDVRHEQSIRSGSAEMVGLWGGIDVLINNAGFGMRTVNPRFLSEPKPFGEVFADGFRELNRGYQLTGPCVSCPLMTSPYFDRGAGREFSGR